ncbi:MAG TPA: hypothetical protein VGW14_07350 [Thermoleophilaceae bacterium]|nr:hypothetical protein [Thermoleophilaceae bacterium]
MEQSTSAPPRIWWARPRKLCALERPGGGGRAHRPDRRAAEIEYLRGRGVWMVVSVMRTRHNIAAYEEAGLDWHHVPVPSAAEGADQLEELLPLLKRDLRRHEVRVTLCAAHMHTERGADPAVALAAAERAGLTVTPAACALVGVEPEEVAAAGRAAA